LYLISFDSPFEGESPDLSGKGFLIG